jgi:hypothetical protein
VYAALSAPAAPEMLAVTSLLLPAPLQLGALCSGCNVSKYTTGRHQPTHKHKMLPYYHTYKCFTLHQARSAIKHTRLARPQPCANMLKVYTAQPCASSQLGRELGKLMAIIYPLKHIMYL